MTKQDYINLLDLAIAQANLLHTDLDLMDRFLETLGEVG